MRCTRSSPLKTWELKLARTKARRRALIAVARKFAVILHRMWMTNEPFRTEATA
ncbi:hypothetical protein GGQ59_000030 [Parvularcula dongshanensis]|uniref:Uncharacterized protein n=1 Tax=Parvularcula dongshanensis TaxID=1173995 RepID=A0A840I090_9PROT|nr:hypothetical protein [Parvularcula dongshanensis]MBB4657530.1 hypothetical protein [Parvularcula dongshanensis]